MTELSEAIPRRRRRPDPVVVGPGVKDEPIAAADDDVLREQILYYRARSTNSRGSGTR